MGAEVALPCVADWRRVTRACPRLAVLIRRCGFVRARKLATDHECSALRGPVRVISAKVEGARVIRACRDAIAAPDAGVVVDDHDAVLALPRGIDGADRRARRIVTLH